MIAKNSAFVTLLEPMQVFSLCLNQSFFAKENCKLVGSF